MVDKPNQPHSPESNENEAILAAYKAAWDDACAEGEKCLEAIKNAENLPDDSSARDIFKKQAARALVASENWRCAAENLRKIMSTDD